MDVYLIPTTTSERYELYYEAPDLDVVEEEEGRGWGDRLTGGLLSRMKRRFSDMLLEAEAWRHRRHEARPDGGLMMRIRRKTMSFIVERIAEQRLLWHMRRAQKVCVCIPDDIGEHDADGIIRTILKRDADHHLKWLIIDAALLVPCAFLIIVPGPNVPGFYFTFQVVAHYLSWTGARKGLALAPWTYKPSGELAELRAVLSLAPAQRQRRFRELADRLRLEHLPTFLDDVAAPPA